MDSMEMYSFEDADGNEEGYTTRDIKDAQRYARENNLRLIANVFEFSDSEMIEDYTVPKDGDEDDIDEDAA